MRVGAALTPAWRWYAASERWGDAMCLFWGYVPTRAMFGIAGREASDAFLGMTEHPSRPSAQLSWDSRANIKYPECQTIQEETSRKWQTDA